MLQELRNLKEKIELAKDSMTESEQEIILEQLYILSERYTQAQQLLERNMEKILEENDLSQVIEIVKKMNLHQDKIQPNTEEKKKEFSNHNLELEDPNFEVIQNRRKKNSENNSKKNLKK